MRYRDLVLKGLKQPRQVPAYIGNRYVSSLLTNVRYELFRRRRGIASQRSCIHEFVEKDEFAIVILDACRYDAFKDVYQEYLKGDLEKVWASGRWTAEYVERTWTDEYDLTYINSAPVISDFYFELRNRDYRPSEHIRTLVNVWETGWDPELRTIPADRITETALGYAGQEDPTRLVVHYMQPHVPYVGEKTLLPCDNAEESSYDGIREVFECDATRPTYAVLDAIEHGDVTDDELEAAYRSNLHYVFAEVARLVRRLDCPVVVTADHGEHLGEEGRYLHESDSTLIRQVPWFVVSDAELNTRTIEPDIEALDEVETDRTTTSDEIRERLADLGYTT